MQNKLNLNKALVDGARQSAKHIAEDTQAFIDIHTTVTVERAVCRLLGIDGVNDFEVPLPNVVVNHLTDRGIRLADCISTMQAPILSVCSVQTQVQ